MGDDMVLIFAGPRPLFLLNLTDCLTSYLSYLRSRFFI